jgi:trans-2,3-dihydro-3-hydroxyanthranilate isomerase
VLGPDAKRIGVAVGLAFYIADVFAEEKYAGNQLAVFRDAGGLPSEEMQKIAAEMNYSETTFVLSEEERDGGYDVRIFTPREEVPFAGHPILGTAHVIRREIVGKPVERVVLNLKGGKTPVEFGRGGGEEGGVLWMEQRPPVFGETFDRGRVGRVLGLGGGRIDPDYPVQEVSTGLPAILVPLKDLAALRQSEVDRQGYFELIRGSGAKALFAFSPEPYNEENDLSARFFADYYGVPEDPATGSAGGCLAGYLLRHGYLGKGPVDVRVEQGHEIGRPSLLYLRAGEDEDGGTRVSVGGKVAMVARGELL